MKKGRVGPLFEVRLIADETSDEAGYSERPLISFVRLKDWRFGVTSDQRVILLDTAQNDNAFKGLMLSPQRIAY